jgi:hypothetical protein
MYVTNTIILQYKPALRQTLESICRVVEFFERVHRSVDLREYRLSYLVSCGGFRSDASSLDTMLRVMR